MSVISFNFDLTEIRDWLSGLEGDAANGFIEAASEKFFETYINSTAVLDICLNSSPRKPFLPFAQQVRVKEPAFEVEGIAAASVDVVVLPTLIERVSNPFRLLRSAFRTLRVGGKVIISVPHRDLYERKYNPPSRWDLSHLRFYTIPSLLLELEAAWGINGFRVRFTREYDRQHDYRSSHDSHASGSYSIIMVLEKIGQGEWYPDIERIDAVRAGDVDARAAERKLMSVDASRILQPRLDTDDIKRLCVLKADHIGDFVMAVPVFEEIRGLFPDAHITCVCGGWNLDLARRLSFFDEVVPCDYYRQNEKYGGNDSASKSTAMQRLGETLQGQVYDLAIDLRVPEDGRELLKVVPASLRAGIGSLERSPFLDIAMPSLEAFSLGIKTAPEAVKIMCRAGTFGARNPIASGPDFILLRPSSDDAHFVWGPYTRLERGAYRIRFFLSVIGRLETAVPVEVDVASQLTTLRVATASVSESDSQVVIEFDAYTDLENVEFRIGMPNEKRQVTLLFSGVELECLTGHPPSRYMPRAQVHMKEQMSLLLALVRTRLFGHMSDVPTLRRRLGVNVGDVRPPAFFAMAPLSNSELRDWPLQNFAELARLLLVESIASVHLFGAPEQGAMLQEIVQAVEKSLQSRMVIRIGLPWSDVYTELVTAEAVVTNNSGMAHVAGMLGARILAIYSASHQALEWGPLGDSVRVVQAALPCGRCGYDLLTECKHGHSCMQMVSPRAILQELRQISPKTFTSPRGPRKLFAAVR